MVAIGNRFNGWSAAHINAVLPLSSLAFGFAPARKTTLSLFFSRDISFVTAINKVIPFSSLIFGSAPAFSNNRVTTLLPAAKITGVPPNLALGLTPPFRRR